MNKFSQLRDEVHKARMKVESLERDLKSIQSRKPWYLELLEALSEVEAPIIISTGEGCIILPR